jgi:two-component system response regulator AdeR
MMRAPRRAVSRGELVDSCLPGGEALERTVDTHLSKLRRKLEEAGAHGYVNNVRGVGFRLADLP